MYIYSKLREISLLVMLSGMFIRCSNSNSDFKIVELKNDFYTINIEAIFNQQNDFSISDIGTDITYIPLETNKGSLLGPVYMVQITESFIFVSEANDNSKLLQFDKKGEFIRQIGRIGRGPGEYQTVMHFSANESANILLLQSEHRFLKYDLNGNFLGDTDKPFHSTYFVFYRQGRIAFYCPNNIETPTNLIITKQDLNPFVKFQNHNPKSKTNIGIIRAPMYIFKNELYFKEHYNDTLFCVEDSLLKPHIIYQEKKLLLDKDFVLNSTGNVSNLERQLEEVKNKLTVNRILEGKRFVFTSYYRGLGPLAKKDIEVLFDKKKNKTYMINEAQFVNDIDGGINFSPQYSADDSIVVAWFTPYRLKSYVATEAFKNSTPKYPEKKKELEQLANSLDENDNPVLMLVKLKE